MKLLITGATGLIGKHIQAICTEKGYAVNYLTTHRNKIKNQPDYQGFYWNPETGEVDKACLKDVDKVIHLAGASVGKRWTKKQRKTIIASRIKSAELLFSLLSQEKHGITQLISASAIGIYPDSLSHLYDENATEKANDFLGLVVQEWEKSVEQFKELGIAVTKIRIGLVLAAEAGILQELKKPIQNYMGTSLGSGKQWQSWIHVDDAARLFVFVAEEELDGIFNAVAPNPVKQKYLVKCMANSLDKPVFLPSVPGPVLKLVMGNMASMVLSSQLVVSKRIKNTGFRFKYHQLEKALDDLV